MELEEGNSPSKCVEQRRGRASGRKKSGGPREKPSRRERAQKTQRAPNSSSSRQMLVARKTPLFSSRWRQRRRRPAFVRGIRNGAASSAPASRRETKTCVCLWTHEARVNLKGINRAHVSLACQSILVIHPDHVNPVQVRSSHAGHLSGEPADICQEGSAFPGANEANSGHAQEIQTGA